MINYNNKIKKIRRKQSKERAFTLIEMMLSLTIFSIVITIIMGTIITIVDVNRKSQSLSVVMNDVNFAFESLTRSFRTGRIDLDASGILDRSGSVHPMNQITVINQNNDRVVYKLENKSVMREITRVGEPAPVIVAITSPQVEVENLTFTVFYGDDNRQPRVLIKIDGEVSVSPTISSRFSIQTTVSQRNLDYFYVANPPNP